MPIFEFRCRECGAKFEQLCSSTDCSNVKCPKCGSTEPRKLISGFGFLGGSKSGAGSGAPSRSSSCSSCSGRSCANCH